MMTTTTGALPLPAGRTTHVRIGLPSTITLMYSPLRGELARRATTPMSSAGSFRLFGAPCATPRANSSSAWPAWMSPPAAIIFRCSMCSAAVIGCGDSARLRRPYRKTTTAAMTAAISAILIARIISVLRLSFFVGRRRRGASGSLVRAGAAEDVAHRVIPLVALVRHHLFLVVRGQRHRERPRLRPRRRIVDRHGPLHFVRRDAPEPLDNFQRLRIRLPVRAPLPEVGRLDDESVAFPVAARVAHVEADALRRMRAAVEQDHARLVDHLVLDRDGVLRLHDAVRVAVDRRHHRSRQAAGDAAIVQTAILGTVRRTATGCLPRRRASGKPGPALRRHRRDFPIRRIDHEPGDAALRMIEAVEPDPARAADLAGQLLRARTLLDAAADRGELLALHVFELAAGQRVGPLERRAHFVQVG